MMIIILSLNYYGDDMSIQKINELVEKIEKGQSITREDAEFIINIKNSEIVPLLWGADHIRRKFFGSKIVNCAIVNAKCGACSEDCSFCAQSAKYNTDVNAYPLLDKETLVNSVVDSEKNDINNFGFVTSGRGITKKDIAIICDSIRELKDKKVEVDNCLSLGILTSEQFEQLKEAGALRYHHNLETSRKNFPNICTTHSYDDRIRTIKLAMESGFEICSGALLGLGESWEDRIDLAFELRDLDVDSIPMNFLNPIPNTPAADFPRMKPLDILKSIALFRFINPSKEIKIAGGREVNLRDLQSMIFFSGANGFMVGNYLVTKGRNTDDDIQMIKDLEFDLK